MTTCIGRRGLLDRIAALHESAHHVSVVGPKSIGKSTILRAVRDNHVAGSSVFAGAEIVDLRHGAPDTAEATLRLVASALREMVSRGPATVRGIADEINLDSPSGEIFEQLKITLDVAAEANTRFLLILDGCDPVLQNSSIPRNLWESLRALAQLRSLRLMTGSRDQLVRLCYNPEARTSDFFRIFWDEPIFVGPFDESDWNDYFKASGLNIDGAARTEFVEWTGGHPDLTDGLLLRLKERAKTGTTTRADVEAAAVATLGKAAGRIESLWIECQETARDDIMALARGPITVSELASERARFLTDRGIATVAGGQLRLRNKFVQRFASERKTDVSAARKMFERPDDFAANIRSVLEHRLTHVSGCDSELKRLITRALRDIPDDPAGCIGNARDIAERAIDLIWSAEAPDGKIPSEWLNAWKFEGMERVPQARLPMSEKRGEHCGILRNATGTERYVRRTKYLTKSTFTLFENLVSVGNARNHRDGRDTQLSFALAFCVSAIALAEALATDTRGAT